MGTSLKVVQVVEPEIVNEEFEQLHRKLLEDVQNFVEFGEDLEQMRVRWHGWKPEERRGYTNLKDYLKFEIGVDDRLAERTAKASIAYRELVRADNYPPDVMPRNQAQMDSLIEVLKDGGWLQVADKGGNPIYRDGAPVTRQLSEQGRKTLLKAWKGVCQEVERKREQLAVETGIPVESIPVSRVLNSRFIKYSPSVTRYVGGPSPKSRDDSKYGVMARYILNLRDKLDEYEQKADANFQVFVDTEGWTLTQKQSIRNILKEVIIASQRWLDGLAPVKCKKEK